MPISCPQCHTSMPDSVVFCTHCGRRIWVPGQAVGVSRPTPPEKTPPARTTPEKKPPERTPSAVVVAASSRVATASTTPIPGSLKDHLTAAVAYVTFIPAILFVLIDPFKRNRFIRFHAFQSIFLAVGVMVTALAMRFLYSLLALIPWLGFLLAWLALLVFCLGLLILWLVLLVKALQGEMFKLPVIGDLAERV